MRASPPQRLSVGRVRRPGFAMEDGSDEEDGVVGDIERDAEQVASLHALLSEKLSAAFDDTTPNGVVETNRLLCPMPP